MKNLKLFLIALLFALLCINVFGEVKTYPFQVKVSGHGKQSLIFIPGFACSGEVWKETLAIYESRYTCYTLTMAGFAGEPAQATPSFNNWEMGIVNYIKANHINKPVIIGHSMGGGLALAIAADYPQLPSQIVVVDALPCLAAMRNPAFTSSPNNDCSAIVNQFKTMNDADFKAMQQKSMPQLLADTSKLNTVVNWSVLSDKTTFATMYCDFMNTDLRNKIKGITCPTLIMLEAQFAGLKPVIADQYKNLNSAQLNYATKGRHFIMYDDKEWYDQQLSAFIK
jgi:pimeloyl-ACP methyl ester carboxylesterase